MDTEYLKALDDEIGADVYFYHNKVSDKIDIFTVGCEISQWDGEKIANLINFDELTDPNGYILFNTCAVTESANTVCKRVAKRLSLAYPKRKIYFMGCGVNYDKNFYASYGTPLTNEEKFNIFKYGCSKKNSAQTIQSDKHREVGFVKIEDGCYNNCAYCIIHKIRPHYQVPYTKIRKEIRALLLQGKRDIQLIGTEIASYKDGDMDLCSLCEKILSDFPEIHNIIIGAIDPASNQLEKLIELIKRDDRVFNSIYLCTQSCCDTILKNMRRRHRVDRLEELNKLADGKVDFVYQLIVGFPGESNSLFMETVNNIKKLKPIDIDTIPFSRRIGTDAYNMPNQVDAKTISNRERILYDAVKSYSSFDDDNQLRAMKPMNKRHISNFMAHAAYSLKGKKVFDFNLYDDNGFYNAFSTIKKYSGNLDDVIIQTHFDESKDMYDLDVNIKLLTAIFGIKVITVVTLTDSLIKFMADGYYTPENFAFRFCTYLSFDFGKLDTANKDDLLNIFKNILIYNIDDVSVMLEKLLKSDNKDYFRYIVDNLGISM